MIKKIARHSDIISAQQIVSACDTYGVDRVVISPGSRNAPLIIEFNSRKDFNLFSIVDERSAAFFALGMAQETKKAVALVCSSGSALLNYYPAIAEAFYSSIPLVIISADRPRHLIDIGDGQTIRQEKIFQNHIHFSANLYEDDPNSNYTLIVEAFKRLKKFKGPIHFNVPFDEPLYNITDEFSVDTNKWEVKVNKDSLLSEEPWEVDKLQKHATIWNNTAKKMVLLGVLPKDEMIQTQLNHLAKDPSVIVLTETTSNVHNNDFIGSIDQLVFPMSNKEFRAFKPEILLTFGGMVVSKKIKQLLRENSPKLHWHIDANRAMDTYHSLSTHFDISPTLFFSQFFFLSKAKKSKYKSLWINLKKQREIQFDTFVKNTDFSDLKVFSLLHNKLYSNSNIQFSNSSVIRYAQLFSWDRRQLIGCNRGTSGIDGSTSTAVGVAVASKQETLLVTGDVSFFYDSNALWNKYIPSTFRIVLINNGGGGIFKFISGPDTTQAIEYFETPHNLTAKQLCEMHSFDYIKAQNEQELNNELVHFFEKSKNPKLLEIFTPSDKNAKILRDYFNLNK